MPSVKAGCEQAASRAPSPALTAGQLQVLASGLPHTGVPVLIRPYNFHRGPKGFRMGQISS